MNLYFNESPFNQDKILLMIHYPDAGLKPKIKNNRQLLLILYDKWYNCSNLTFMNEDI
jgi:hypothetical protein